MNKFAKICLGISGAIMFTFFSVQTCIVFGLCEPSYFLAKFGYGCVIAFMPPFFYVVYDFIKTTKLKEENIDSQLSAINESNMMAMFTSEGVVLSANKNFLDAFGYSEKDVIGKEHKIFIDKKMAHSYDYVHFWKSLENGHRNSGEFERFDKNGNPLWLFGTYIPIKDKDGNYSTVLKIASNITQQHESEVLLNQKNSYLEHAAKILRHDMHSGINTYMPRGLTSLRRRISEEQIKELKIDAPLKMLEEGLRHTQRVFKGVKEFTNLVKEDAQLDKTPCNLADILRNYLSSTSYIKQVDIGILPTIDVNEPLFCTAIDNLIRNGLKYNDSPTKVVKVYMGGERRLCVEDNGRGMTQEEFLYLSKPYTRKKEQSEGGSGLGLNICIAILKEHGFVIKVEKLKQGTKMIITI